MHWKSHAPNMFDQAQRTVYLLCIAAMRGLGMAIPEENPDHSKIQILSESVTMLIECRKQS